MSLTAIRGFTGDMGLALWHTIRVKASRPGPLGGGRYLAGSRGHRARLRAWQALTVLADFVGDGDVDEAAVQLWNALQVRACIKLLVTKWGLPVSSC